MPQGASWVIVHDSHGLNIKTFDHLYKESRALSLSNIRFFSDDCVKHALDSKEGRASKWSRKFSSATYVKGLIEEVVPPVAVQVPSFTEDERLDDSLSDSSLAEPAPTPPARPPAELSRNHSRV